MPRKMRFAIILAGGKGTRMRSADLHKACFPIDGRPAIVRALDVYRASGIEQPIIVVGAMADQVMDTIAQAHEGVIYAYQAEQLGTGHAARQGARVLRTLARDDEDVLLVVGDRIIDPAVLERLIDRYYAEDCDLAFVVIPEAQSPGSGRVLINPDGSALAVVERRDIRKIRALARIRQTIDDGSLPLRSEALAILCQEMDERQAAVAFGPLWQALTAEGPEPSREQWDAWVPAANCHFAFVDADGHMVTIDPDTVDATPLVNPSVYLVKLASLNLALSLLRADNAQGEEYLTDIINILVQRRRADGRRHRVYPVRIDEPGQILGYNNPDELLQIEEHFRSKRQEQTTPGLHHGPAYRPVREWIVAMNEIGTSQGGEPALRRELAAIYGTEPELLGARRRAYLVVLEKAARVLGPSCPVLLVRAPGRVNILGRHVDHQGGNCNLMAIDREIVMAVHPRDDDEVNLYNVAEEPFGSRHFSIGEMLSQLPWDDWLSLVNSERVQEMVREAAGDWTQYVCAAMLRLQKRFPTVRLRGLDLVVHGNIPVAAGLSSSSALVVAAAEATVVANALEVLPSQLVDLCGEGEWFVGTRGGSADHAAIKFGQKGKVAKVTFFDFAVERMVDFPSSCCLVICDSRIQAKKSGEARDIYNQRVACYRLGYQLIRARYRQYAPLIHHLRDVNVRNLSVPLSWVYRILLSLPERASREELAELLPEEVLEPILATHAPLPDGYPIRGVVLFGLAECERSRVGVDLLGSGQVEEFGRLMRASHDGDRVVSHGADGMPHPYRSPVSNAYLLDLLVDLESGDPERVLPAQLKWQPGAYRCSTPEIDLMVDIALQVPGVMGAQLAGAGLGGCMMVLARREAANALVERMQDLYYAPRGFESGASICTPIAGSGVLLDPRAV